MYLDAFNINFSTLKMSLSSSKVEYSPLNAFYIGVPLVHSLGSKNHHYYINLNEKIYIYAI